MSTYTTNASSGNFSDLEKLSFTVLKANIVPDSLWIVFGSLGSFCAALTLVTILAPKNKTSLAGVHYRNIVHLAVSEFLNNFAHTIFSIREISIALRGGSDVTSISACAIQGLYNTFVINVVSGQTVALVATRLFAVTMPVCFRQIQILKIQRANYGFWLFGITVAVVDGFRLVSQRALPACKFSLIFQPWGQQLPNAIVNAMAALVLLMTIALVGALIYRFRTSAAKQRVGIQQQVRRPAINANEIAATKAACIVCLQYTVTFLAPCVVSQIFLLSQNSAQSYTIQPIANACWGLHSIAQFFIYFCTDNRFRRGTAKLFGPINAVVPNFAPPAAAVVRAVSVVPPPLAAVQA